jgi:NAD(P)H-nitrite reductase large subunit
MSNIEKIKYLIIGNSAGGIGTAEAIRELDKEGTLAIVCDEPYPTYSRPLISEYLLNPQSITKILYRQPDFYRENNIGFISRVKVVEINTRQHIVKLENGKTLGYEKLLLAAGSTPITPVLEGAGLGGVFTFNKLDDAKAIYTFLNQNRQNPKAVVIGGGLIGVSVTEALVKRAVEVTVVEMKDYLLNTILDKEVSAMATDAMVKAGVNIVTGHTVKSINSYQVDKVSGVTLNDGRLLPCDLVIVAIGVKPRLDILANSNIKTNRGIIVDRHMATSASDIYACGDVAEAYDFVIGESRLTPVWPNAYEGGRVAGLNMAGQVTEYTGGTAMNALKYFGLNIVSAGLVNPPDDSYETIINRHDGVYRKVILRNDRVVGLASAGDIEKSGIIYSLMKDGVNVSKFKESLVAEDFGLASLPEVVWRQKLSKPAATSIAITPVEEPEEAVIGD